MVHGEPQKVIGFGIDVKLCHVQKYALKSNNVTLYCLK